MMRKQISLGLGFLLPFLALGVTIALIGMGPNSIAVAEVSLARSEAPRALFASDPTTLYLPVIMNNYPWISPFGVEPNPLLLPGTMLYTRTVELGAGWVRLNGSNRISWRLLQPQRGGPILWENLASFESELRALKAAGIHPIVIVDDYPLWATLGRNGADGQPSYCDALKDDAFADYAQFLRALVARYKSPEFDVHDWELGNEPDVDPRLVPHDSPFGCWGDIEDPYYGGRRYGEMLKLVVPAIRAEDPTARIWIGGLLLNRPGIYEGPGKGTPGLFFQGILESGAAPYLDIVAYHAYPTYVNRYYDYDLNAAWWTSWGGNTLGKAAYLRGIMTRYGVDKPLFLNETGLMCPEYYSWCTPPDEQFFQIQASHVVRSFVRGISGGIRGFVWYTINGPGWRYTGLLNSDGSPKPVYIAYQVMIQQLQNTRYLGTITYTEGTEGYVFRRGPEILDVVWVVENRGLTVDIPQNKFLRALTRDGVPITPTLAGTNYRIPVGFEPVYIVRQP